MLCFENYTTQDSFLNADDKKRTYTKKMSTTRHQYINRKKKRF